MMRLIMRNECKREMQIEEREWGGGQEAGGERGRGGERESGRVSILIDQTCRQPDSQGDVCPCAATLWPADT